MANTSSYVSTGKPKLSGAIYAAELSQTLSIPSDATTALSNDYVCLGYISEDGLVNAYSTETEDIKAWGGDTVLTVKTSTDDKFKFTLLETMNEEVLKKVFGEDNVSGSLASGLSVSVNGGERDSYCWVFELVLQNNVAKRIVIPQANVTELSDINYKDDEAIGYEVSITAVPDSSGNTHYEYMKS